MDTITEPFYKFSADKHETYNGHKYPHIGYKKSLINLLDEESEIKQDMKDMERLKKKTI